jgi:hypothetical protein
MHTGRDAKGSKRPQSDGDKFVKLWPSESIREEVMKQIDLSQTIGVLANLGVIAGIVFLAIELQQNNELLGSQARTARAAVAIDSANTRVTTPELWRALMKDEHGEPLSAEEEYLIGIWYWGILQRFQYVYGEYEAGLIEDADIPVGDWQAFFVDGGVMEKLWHDIAETHFRPDFVEFMEREVVNR